MKTPSPGSPARLLVVEDDHDVRDSIVEILQEAGYDVRAAPDGAVALAQLEAPGPLPDLILLDLMMPRMSGAEFRAAQQTQPRLEKIPVAILTADGSAKDKAASLHAAGFLRKPLKIDQLLALVSRILA